MILCNIMHAFKQSIFQLHKYLTNSKYSINRFCLKMKMHTLGIQVVGIRKKKWPLEIRYLNQNSKRCYMTMVKAFVLMELQSMSYEQLMEPFAAAPLMIVWLSRIIRARAYN